MAENCRTVCPNPYLGNCVRERCNCWDEVRRECSELGGDVQISLEDRDLSAGYGPCIIYWTEDAD